MVDRTVGSPCRNAGSNNYCYSRPNYAPDSEGCHGVLCSLSAPFQRPPYRFGFAIAKDMEPIVNQALMGLRSGR